MMPVPAELSTDGEEHSGRELVDPAAALARFAWSFSLEQAPVEVVNRAKLLILDAVGIALASSNSDFAHRTSSALEWLGGAGPSAVIGLPGRLTCRDAAMLNGVLCHGLDYDDTHLPSVVHPTAATFPAALGAAIHTGASGPQLLAAYMLGVESACRIGSVAGSGFIDAGFNPTGTVSTFAASITAGKLFGLDANALELAQGIALDITAPGSLAFLEGGAWTKRLVPGWAAAAGISSAALAAKGFVGPKSPYTGRYGIYRLLLRERAERGNAAEAAARLGDRWRLMEVSFKPFPVCHFVHASLDAAVALRAEHGITSDAIQAVEILVPAGVVETICEPLASKQRPSNTYEAQFSAPFLVAAALTRGRIGFEEIDSSACSDRDILDLSSRVSYAVDTESSYPRFYTGEVVITLNDGRTLRRREAVNRGTPENPLSETEVVEKFLSNATCRLVSARAEQICETVLSLDRIPESSTLNDALAS